VGSATDGAQGVAKLSGCDPDVVVLDIEMPVMTGLEALPKLLAAKPGLRVVMASTLTAGGAAVTMQALQLGASDYVAKPDSSRIGGAENYRQELFAKIRALGARAVSRRSCVATTTQEKPTPRGNGGWTTRPSPSTFTRPEILAVGSSTGGPQALREFFAAINGSWRGPIVVVQHMPATFTALLAEQLSKIYPLGAVEAQDGMPLVPGRIHLARGDYHMTIREDRSGPRLSLNQERQENFCRPAVDPLFRSVAAVYGPGALGVILTGMGHDGRDGARALVDAGGVVLAQDEASSVVWGMPAAVAQAGLATLVDSPSKLAAAVCKLSSGERL
jgi:two-component system chemotaxis response regulator CheB